MRYLVAALEYTSFRLCSNAKQISVRLARFRRSYVVNRLGVVLVNHTSYTDFLVDVCCAVQSGCVPFFCSCLSPVIVHLCNLFLLSSSVKWGHLAHFEPNSTNTIFSTNPMGVIYPTLSQALFFIIIITLIVSWCLENKYNENFKGI